MPTPSADESLMTAYAAGDAASLEELFTRYAPILLRVLRRGLATREEAEDLLQQTFLQLHRARHDFDPTHRFRPWLLTIALNLRREHARRLKRRQEWPLELVAEPRIDARDWARADAARDLERALATLPPDQRDVIELHWLEGLSFQEVAQVLGCTHSNAKVRAHRGYVRLRQQLSRTSRASEDGGRRNQPRRNGI